MEVRASFVVMCILITGIVWRAGGVLLHGPFSMQKCICQRLGVLKNS